MRDLKAWAYYLRSKFGITPEEYEAQLKYQGYACPICGRDLRRVRANLDHDHRTRRLRGVVCWWDNRYTIGSGRVTPEMHENVAKYLRARGVWTGPAKFVPEKKRRRKKARGRRG